MDWLTKMNAALDYIEENLTEEIDYQKVAKKACCSSYNFQRMFSFIADVTLAEYIRRRRLTLAALELAREEHTVLEVAMKYGYDSPVSFGRAFYNLHGITPKEAKAEGAVLKNYPRISFQIVIKGVEEMKYRMETMKGFRLVGVKKTVTTEQNQNFAIIPKFWDELYKNGTYAKICALGLPDQQELYGICYNMQGNEFDYMIGVRSEQPVPEGMVEVMIPDSLFAKFECRGQLPDSQQKVWKRLYTEWLPTSGYEHAGTPELEWYSKEDMDADDYLSEIWIPVKKCN